MFVGDELKKMESEYPQMELEKVEMTFNFMQAWKDGIRMFPAVKIGDDVLSGVLLSSKKVRSFVEERLPA